ncbi:type IV pilus modification PilV family protein [Metabacillus sp. 84]|uniref:type IV pilus modification PilV family protein n=1 Tax=unclassified Metabacillus TaxID=2675274 RepID=UPI003CF9595B
MFERFISPDKNGFTLIEVLLSISIFSILTLGMLQFFTQAMDFSGKNEDKTIGIYVARNMLNYMEQQSFSAVSGHYLTGSGPVNITGEACQSDKLSSGRTVLNQTEQIVISGNRTSKCELNFSPEINNRQYEVSVTIQKHSSIDLQDSLIPITVSVEWDEDDTELGGYIAIEKNR